MKTQIFKPILGGLLFGTLAWFMPFFLMKVFFFFLIAGTLFRLFARRRFGPDWKAGRMAWIDKIRNMTTEEYEDFKSRSMHHACGYKTQTVSSTNS